jgi:phosphomannomutase
LNDLWREFGLWVSAQHSIVRPGAEGLKAIQSAVATLAANPPDTLGAYEIDAVTDFSVGADQRPMWLGAQALVELSLGDQGRVLVRPSGTEPKLKIYVDLRGDAGAEPQKRHKELSDSSAQLAKSFAHTLSI